ncbi:mannitol dehydrogenase [Clostridia bacterium]|nr:mannitol dehydrogenase [Clostridia bacterium]
MKLSRTAVNNKNFWQSRDITLPQYSISEMRESTKQNPRWLHFGAGNIFRAFIAKLQQDLLNQKIVTEGLIVAESFDFDLIDEIYMPYEQLTLLVTLYPNASTQKEILSSIASSYRAHSSFPKDYQALQNIFRQPSLQVISFTITEKGYALEDIAGNILPILEQDSKKTPDQANHTLSIVTALLYQRYLAGELPIALLSLDNCSHNGDKLEDTILYIAKQWISAGFVKTDFLAYLTDKSKVSFPWSMIDKITPRPAITIYEQLTALGIEGMEPITTNKQTFTAPFVNAEAPQYLVIEDHFPNGRPPLEQVGVYFTDRQTVDQTEKMKVTTCLNPLHTALAIWGCLLGYTSIAEEMKDPDLKQFIQRLAHQEALPVVTNPNIIQPTEFLNEVLETRLPNPFIPDTPQRIATDTSQKMAIRFGETIKAYDSIPHLDVNNLTYIPLVIAAWFRYLLGVDDNGNQFTPSSDPLLKELQTNLQSVQFGEIQSYHGQLRTFLGNTSLFGIDLCKTGLDHKIEEMFKHLISQKGAVKHTLRKYLEN